jgi:SAM-dependent methyltransferase
MEDEDGYFGERVAATYDGTSGVFGPGTVEATAGVLAELAGGGRALELAIGTGRIALPLARRGVEVHGIELSRAMVARLRAKPGGEDIPVAIGDMATTTVDGTFSLVYLSGSKPAPGQEVALFWESTKRFGGIVLTTAESRIKGPANVTRIQVTCTGYQAYLDRAIVAKLYTIAISGDPIIIFDIWYNKLSQFGISLVYPQGPPSGYFEQLFHYVTVTEVFNTMRAANSGYDWWIDDNKALIWKAFGSGGAAPFTIRNGDVNQDSVTVETSNKKFPSVVTAS